MFMCVHPAWSNTKIWETKIKLTQSSVTIKDRLTDNNGEHLLPTDKEKTYTTQTHNLICNFSNITWHVHMEVGGTLCICRESIRIDLRLRRGQVEQRVSLWMIAADKNANKNISCGQAIYLQPPLSPHLPPMIPVLLVLQMPGDWLVIIMIFCSPWNYVIPKMQMCFLGSLLQVW